MKVAFQGEAGAFSESAVEQIFPDAEPVGVERIREVFSVVESGQASFGVVPLQNSHAGSIDESYEAFLASNLSLLAEKAIAVSHCLMGLNGVVVTELRQVMSHPQALEQCREFLVRLGVQPVPVYDTAGAALKLSQSKDREVAVLASQKAARLYGLSIIEADVQDSSENSTRFGVVGRSGMESFGSPSKTSLVFATADEPGALLRCLTEFGARRINLSRLESRPSKEKAWQYHFYVDLDVPPENSAAAQEALASLAKITPFMKVFGNYPVL